MSERHAGVSAGIELPGSFSSRALDPDRTVLRPPAAIGTRWAGALQARLDRDPLEGFIRTHCEKSSLDATHGIVTEQLTLACLLFVEPVLPHRGDGWPALRDPAYLDAVAEATSHIGRTLSTLIRQPHLWRVAALRGTARLLIPVLGLDLAAPAAAAGVSRFAKGPLAGTFLQGPLDIAVAQAVASCSRARLEAARDIVRSALAQAAVGASTGLSFLPLTAMVVSDACNS